METNPNPPATPNKDAAPSSLLTFFALVFLLSTPFWILGFLKPVMLLPGLPISALGTFVPALSGLILAYRSGHLSGALRLLQRSFDFKRIPNAAWMLVVIFIYPAITFLAYVGMRIGGLSLPPYGPVTLSAILLFVGFFIAALGEEIGWTGFAMQPLLDRWGVAWTGIGLGLIWAAIHFVPLWQAQRSPEWIAWWSLETVSLRIIMVWLYQHTGGSVFAAAVFHALINLCWQLFPIQGSYYDPRIFGLVALLFAAFILIGARLLHGSRLQPAR